MFVLALILMGCVAATQQQEQLNLYPSVRSSYSYSYDPVESAPPRSVPVVIAVVNPMYRETDSALMQKAYRNVGKGFSASMGVDMDKLLVAKGMTTLGPYATLDDIVYSSKKNASLTLAPKVFITLDTEYTGDWERYKGRTYTKPLEYRMGRNFRMNVRGWVAFILQEPLSGEKMWVKKLELDEKEMLGIEYRVPIENYTTRYGFFGDEIREFSHYSVGAEIIYDGKIEALADYLNEIYPIIMGKCWTYMDTEELMHLKETSQEIRVLKRY